jgi:hypothetical protein
MSSAQKPWAGGRHARRMNSVSRGLRPTVGLRRPRRCLLRRRRPTPGAQRPGRPISIGVKASGRRSACAPNEFGLQGPSANGRPAPTGKVSLASAKADARRAAPWKADFNRQERLQPRPLRDRGDRGCGLKALPSETMAVTIGTPVRGESPSYKKRPLRDREDRGCGAESPSPRNDRRCHRDPLPGAKAQGARRRREGPKGIPAGSPRQAPDGAEPPGVSQNHRTTARSCPTRRPGPTKSGHTRAASFTCSRPIRGRDAPQRIPTWL